MGDRGNAKVVNDGKSVYLYTHWTGSDLPQIVKAAMARGESRWNDHSYLTRIIFSEMIRGYEHELIGFGISADLGDGDDQIMTINCNKQTVQWNGGRPKSFRDFIK